ncbi:MAG TPA: hypothetical protein VIQ23_14045, partial [Hanamia sp.]
MAPFFPTIDVPRHGSLQLLLRVAFNSVGMVFIFPNYAPLPYRLCEKTCATEIKFAFEMTKHVFVAIFSTLKEGSTFFGRKHNLRITESISSSG